MAARNKNDSRPNRKLGEQWIERNQIRAVMLRNCVERQRRYGTVATRHLEIGAEGGL